MGIITDLFSTSSKGNRDEEVNFSHFINLPDIKVKGDVRLDLKFVPVCRFKNAVIGAIIVFEQLIVQKPENKGDGGLDE